MGKLVAGGAISSANLPEYQAALQRHLETREVRTYDTITRVSLSPVIIRGCRYDSLAHDCEEDVAAIEIILQLYLTEKRIQALFPELERFRALSLQAVAVHPTRGGSPGSAGRRRAERRRGRNLRRRDRRARPSAVANGPPAASAAPAAARAVRPSLGEARSRAAASIWSTIDANRSRWMVRILRLSPLATRWGQKTAYF